MGVMSKKIKNFSADASWIAYETEAESVSMNPPQARAQKRKIGELASSKRLGRSNSPRQSS